MGQEFEVVVLGGGAAGLMCALEAGRRGKRVVVLERADRVGKKILISGGGRCNFTNLYCSAENFISGNADFCRSALARFTPGDFVALVERHGIGWHEKKPYEGAAAGQLFCDRSAEDIVGLLVEECRAAGVRIFVGVQVMEVRRGVGGGFVVSARGGMGGFTTEFAEGTEIGEAERIGRAEGLPRGARADEGGSAMQKGGVTAGDGGPLGKAGATGEDGGPLRKAGTTGGDETRSGRMGATRGSRRGAMLAVGSAGDWEIAAAAVVVATGGLSIPKMGATGFGYEVARQFGHSIVETRPGLVPLTFGRGDAREWAELAGVSAMVEVGCGNAGGAASGPARGRAAETRAARLKRGAGAGMGPTFREKMLFTHRGLSGPAILQVSSYWGSAAREPVWIDLAPGVEWTTALREGGGPATAGGSASMGARRDLAAARTALRRILPVRLADAWLDWAVKSGKVGGDWTNAGLAAAEHELHRWQVRPAGTEGYEKAEVTVGGVNTEELSSKTMESRLVPGLYFVGEVVDVTGWLGGFNFQWAWASGAAAGRAV